MGLLQCPLLQYASSNDDNQNFEGFLSDPFSCKSYSTSTRTEYFYSSCDTLQVDVNTCMTSYSSTVQQMSASAIVLSIAKCSCRNYIYNCEKAVKHRLVLVIVIIEA